MFVLKHVYRSVVSVQWKPRVIAKWFKHLGILVAVAVHSIESDGKYFVSLFGNPSECDPCEVNLFSTSRKKWRDFAVWHCLFEGQSSEFFDFPSLLVSFILNKTGNWKHLKIKYYVVFNGLKQKKWRNEKKYFWKRIEKI
jgi:hypothetical protein